MADQELTPDEAFRALAELFQRWPSANVCYWHLAEIPKPQANVCFWGNADIVPTKQCKKPAHAKAMSPLWRIGFQPCIAQNFCFFVFGGQHGWTVLPVLSVCDW